LNKRPGSVVINESGHLKHVQAFEKTSGLFKDVRAMVITFGPLNRGPGLGIVVQAYVNTSMPWNSPKGI
jgi:hypothetical protein